MSPWLGDENAGSAAYNATLSLQAGWCSTVNDVQESVFFIMQKCKVSILNLYFPYFVLAMFLYHNFAFSVQAKLPF